MKQRQGAWSPDEMLRVLVAYGSLTPDKRIRVEKVFLEELQKKMPKRTLDSLQMRINNYIARDPEMKALGKKGMYSGGAHVDKFWGQYSDSEGFLDLRKLLAGAATLL